MSDWETGTAWTSTMTTEEEHEIRITRLEKDVQTLERCLVGVAVLVAIGLLLLILG